MLIGTKPGLHRLEIFFRFLVGFDGLGVFFLHGLESGLILFRLVLLFAHRLLVARDVLLQVRFRLLLRLQTALLGWRRQEGKEEESG